MQIGDQLICLVWSFANQQAEDPYSIVLREGATKRKVCNCPAFIYSGGKTCKHITALKQGVKDGTITTDPRFQLTDFGRQLLKLT